MNPKKLNDLRKNIDMVDAELVRLINERGKISHEIGSMKKSGKQPLYSPDRESQVYARIGSKSKGPIPVESMKSIYREIMSACLSLQQPLTVAYLGPELTFTHQASLSKFGSSVNYLPCDGIPDVFREVEKNNAEYGVVPIENSTEGAISHTLDVFVRSPLVICSEIYFPIKHSLLSRCTGISSIEKVYSNPQVFGQCRKWLEKNMPNAKLREAVSTAKAAEIISKQPLSAGAACIASELAAKRYELKILARSIQDSATNITRFLVIGRAMSKISGKDRTSIVFSVKDKPGVLHDMLTPFKRAGINLTKIESRPSRERLWKYYFFVYMEGHCESGILRKALKGLERKCYFLKILGSYPSAR